MKYLSQNNWRHLYFEHNTHAHSNYILGHSIIYFCNFLQKVIDKLYDLHYCQLIMSHL